MKITVLGSGTSAGVPTLGCSCAVCHSADPRDNRLRPSIAVEFDGHHVLIDITPDFRQQALRSRLPRLDAILFTHAHADHIMGLDDVRPFNFRQGAPIPIYGSADTIGQIKQTFSYIFTVKKVETFIPKLEVHALEGGSFDLFGVTFTPIPLKHGPAIIYGYRFGDSAYLTDHSDIPEESQALLQNLDVLFLDALRHKPHPTHSTVKKSLCHVATLQPKRAFLTHICHDLPHEETERSLPSHVRLAYDGLEIEV